MNTIQQISGSLGTLSILANRYVPTAMGCAITALGLGIAAYQTPRMWKTAHDVRENVQNIFNEILSECGLKAGSISCKILPTDSTDARALTNRTLTITPSVAGDLISPDPKKALLSRAIIKHEIGHCYHNHFISRIAKVAGLLCTVYSFNKLLERYVLIPLTSYNPVLGVIGCVFTAYVQLKCFYEATLRIRRHEEEQADQFSIQHACSKEELEASAENFEKDFESYLKDIPILQVGFWNIGDQFKNRPNKNQTLREWAIENRHLPGVGGESAIHPTLYDRAITFRKAAEAFKGVGK